MMRAKHRRVATVAALLVGSAAVARAADPTVQELQQQIQQLQAQVVDMPKVRAQLAELQAKQDQQQNSVALAAVADTVLRDAEKRSQLLAGGGEMTAGYENGRFFIGSSDGNFMLRPWLHMEFRGVANYRQDGKNSVSDDTETGFELRRMRLGFDGNLGGQDLTYLFNWATNRGSGSSNVSDSTGAKIGTVNNGAGGLPVLEEAFAKYHIPGTCFYIRAGQMHDPLAHEAIVGSKYEITPERSLQNDIFANVDTFTQGVTFIWDPKAELRFEGGVTDGIRSANTNFQDQPNNSIAYNYGVAARLEYKAMGEWSDYNQITAYGNKKDLLVFGLGVDYSETGSTSCLTHAFDVQYGGANGLFLYASYIGRYTSNTLGLPNAAGVSTSFQSPANPGQDTYEPSVLFQASYIVAKNWEPYLRYEYMCLAGTPAGSENTVHEISGGVNYWMHGHNAKITTQLMYLPNGIPIDDSSSDVLISNGSHEWVLTTQFQLLL
ncbi:MAG: hypothetical protein ACHRHE_00300 [Tepidisphaerales bacterium]